MHWEGAGGGHYLKGGVALREIRNALSLSLVKKREQTIPKPITVLLPKAMCEGKKIAHRQNTLFACPSSAVCFICVGKSYSAYLHILDVWPPSVCPLRAPRSE